MIMNMASLYRTTFSHPVCVYNTIYSRMNQLNQSKIDWKQQKECYKTQHHVPFGEYFSRKDVIQDDPALTQLFTAAVNMLWEEMENAK